MKQILGVLKERDDLMNDREWVLKEAMSGKKLQSGGTFRNVLSRKLSEVVVPIFASILMAIDHYSNVSAAWRGRVRKPWLPNRQQRLKK